MGIFHFKNLVIYDGVVVQWNREMRVKIQVKPKLADAVCGMCGTPDGNPDNDFVMGPNDVYCLGHLDVDKKPGQPVSLCFFHEMRNV